MNKARQILNVLTKTGTAGQKINYLRYALSRRGERLKYAPVTISVVATTRCTLSCDMCPTHSRLVPQEYKHRQRNEKEIGIELFRKVIDRYKYAREVHIIGSGEPLLNADLFRMISYAAEKKMKVKTFSNGTELQKHVGEILSSGLDGITISLNGHNAREFSRMTGMSPEVYSRIYNGVKALIDEKRNVGSGVKVKLSFILDRYNYRDIPAMVNTGIGLGADHIFFCNFLPSPYEGLDASCRTLTKDEGIITELRGIFRRLPAAVRKKVTPPVLVDNGSAYNRCGSHFSQIRVDGDGNVSSCSMMLLNMTECASIEDPDAWNSAFFRRMRGIFMSGDLKDLPEPCKACPDNKGYQVIGRLGFGD